jgi:hypothetical protein
MDKLVLFLNARLDEDEARASNTYVIPSGGVGRQGDPRGFAEVKAKREIVNELSTALRYDESINELVSSTAAAGKAVLFHLASVYADHPDFDPSWR